MTFVSISDIQNNWHLLDDPAFKLPADVRLISHERFSCCSQIEVEYTPPETWARCCRFFGPIFHICYAIELLWQCTAKTVLILNGGGSLWLFVGLLNRVPLIGKRRILCWDIFVEVDHGWKKLIMRAAMKGFALSVLWSKSQVATHSEYLGMPEHKFIFLPFKANHSRGPRFSLPLDNYLFAGGNGKRDYRCLIDAVRDTGIPVIISATAPEVRKQIELLPNVIILAASEPAFAQLQAASRFIVIPMTYTGLKGGGEANFCNGMWHGKPVIAADNIAASDYIIDGETGFVVSSGDAKMLRQRIVDLWKDPEKASTMGEAARRHVESHFTHDLFINRLLRLALLVGVEL